MSNQPYCLDAVLPLIMRDFPRAQILRRSIECFFPDLGTCHVVTPDAEADAARAAFRGGPYEIVPETTLVPEFRSCAKVSGWSRQQLIKLAIADRIRTPFYLTLDADVFLVRLTRAADLVVEGRALAHRTKKQYQPEWYEMAERVLGLPRPSWHHSVTPALFARDAVFALRKHLRARDPLGRRLWRALTQPTRHNRRLAFSRNWRQDLLLKLPWTEYALYHTFLEATGQFERFHQHRDRGLYGNCVWRADDFAAWNPATSFTGERQFFFSVVQSNTGIDPARIAELVDPYLNGYVVSFTIPARERQQEQDPLPPPALPPHNRLTIRPPTAS